MVNKVSVGGRFVSEHNSSGDLSGSAAAADTPGHCVAACSTNVLTSASEKSFPGVFVPSNYTEKGLKTGV